MKIAEFAELPFSESNKKMTFIPRIRNKFYEQFPKIMKSTWENRICKIIGAKKPDIAFRPSDKNMKKLSARMKKILDDPNQMINRDMIYALAKEFFPTMPIEFIGAVYCLHKGLLTRQQLHYYRTKATTDGTNICAFKEYQPEDPTAWKITPN